LLISDIQTVPIFSKFSIVDVPKEALVLRLFCERRSIGDLLGNLGGGRLEGLKSALGLRTVAAVERSSIRIQLILKSKRLLLGLGGLLGEQFYLLLNVELFLGLPMTLKLIAHQLRIVLRRYLELLGLLVLIPRKIIGLGRQLRIDDVFVFEVGVHID